MTQTTTRWWRSNSGCKSVNTLSSKYSQRGFQRTNCTWTGTRWKSRTRKKRRTRLKNTGGMCTLRMPTIVHMRRGVWGWRRTRSWTSRGRLSSKGRRIKRLAMGLWRVEENRRSRRWTGFKLILPDSKYLLLFVGRRSAVCLAGNGSGMRMRLSTTSIKKTKSTTKNYKEISRPMLLPSGLPSKSTAIKIDLFSLPSKWLIGFYLLPTHFCYFYTSLLNLNQLLAIC